MTSPQELILKLQNLLTNASGADLQQFLAGLEQPGPAPAEDDLTPDGRIKVAMPSKNGTTTPQWCERVAIALQRANAPIYNLAGSPVYITDDGKTVYLTPTISSPPRKSISARALSAPKTTPRLFTSP